MDTYISGLSGSTYKEKLNELGLDSLIDRRKRIDMTQVYKILKGKDSVCKTTWFTTYDTNSQATTRLGQYQDNLKRTRVSKTDIRAKFFSQRVINDWNALPTEVKNSPSTTSFKKNYDNFVKDVGSETTNPDQPR